MSNAKNVSKLEKKIQSAISERLQLITNSNQNTELDNKSLQDIKIEFARHKKLFKVIIVQRGGSIQCNGKYSISGRQNGALRFVNNNNPKFELKRIYVDYEEQEAIWAIRFLFLCANFFWFLFFGSALFDVLYSQCMPIQTRKPKPKIEKKNVKKKKIKRG